MQQGTWKQSRSLAFTQCLSLYRGTRGLAEDKAPLIGAETARKQKPTNKAHVQIRLGVSKQVCNTQVRVSELSVFELFLTYNGQTESTRGSRHQEQNTKPEGTGEMMAAAV